MPNKNYTEIMEEVETEHEDALAELVEFSEKLTKTPDSIFEKITKEMFDLYKKKKDRKSVV